MTISTLVLALLLWFATSGGLVRAAAASPGGDCSSEAALAGRSDVVFCEPWENSAWWQEGYVADGSKTQPRPVTAERVARTSVVSAGCVSGQHPEELFIRYYLKLSENFDPNVCGPDGKVVDSGGKLPGPADVRSDADP